MKNLVKIRYNDYSSIKLVKSFLEHLNNDYPNFSSWFDTYYSKETINRIVISLYIESSLVGIALLKKCDEEAKICCFYILPEYQNEGLGTRLMELSMDFFKGRDVILSISENNIEKIYPFFKKHDFILNNIEKSIYKENINEYFFIKKA